MIYLNIAIIFYLFDPNNGIGINMGNFKIVISSDSEEFENQINDYLNNGWLIINCTSTKLQSSDEFVYHGFIKKLDSKNTFRARSRDSDRGGDRSRSYSGDKGRDRSRRSDGEGERTRPRSYSGDKDSYQSRSSGGDQDRRKSRDSNEGKEKSERWAKRRNE